MPAALHGDHATGGDRVAVLWMHLLDNSKKLGISSTVLGFEPGTPEARAEKKAPGR
jgi:hypothetical protein